MHRSFHDLSLSFICSTTKAPMQHTMTERPLWFSPGWILQRRHSLWPQAASSLPWHPDFQPHESIDFCPEHSGPSQVAMLCACHSLPEECLSYLHFLQRSSSTLQVQPYGLVRVQPALILQEWSGCGAPRSPFSCCPHLGHHSIHCSHREELSFRVCCS